MRPIIFAIGIVALIFILFFGRFILKLVFDNELIISYSIVFKILGPVSVLSGLNMLYNTLYFPSIKKYKIRMNILIFAGIFNLINGVVFTKFYGIYGLAVIVLATELFLLILGHYYFRKHSINRVNF